MYVNSKLRKASPIFLQLKMAEIDFYYENIILGVKYFVAEGKMFLKFYVLSAPAQFNVCLLLIGLALLAIP